MSAIEPEPSIEGLRHARNLLEKRALKAEQRAETFKAERDEARACLEIVKIEARAEFGRIRADSATEIEWLRERSEEHTSELQSH